MCLLRFYKIDVLRTDDRIDRFVGSESGIHTGNSAPRIFTSLSSTMMPLNDVAVSDEVGYESIFRLVVDIFRCTDLLDVSLIHDNNRIRHGEGFFLIVGNIDKCDSQFIFQTDQLILHVLTEFQIQSTERFVQKKNLWFIYNGAGDGNTLLLTTA